MIPSGHFYILLSIMFPITSVSINTLWYQRAILRYQALQSVPDMNNGKLYQIKNIKFINQFRLLDGGSLLGNVLGKKYI